MPTNVGTAGLNFDYTVWTPGTRVELLNVPWDAMYRDVVWFDQGKLDEFLDSQAIAFFTLDSLTYCKPGSPVRVPLSFNSAWQFNYLRVRNPQQPGVNDPKRTYYYFINDVRYVNPNTTELVVQLDVWQTFIHKVEVVRAYVERGHMAIACQESFWDYGRKVLTQPEGFDLGSDYVTTDASAAMLCGTSANKNFAGAKMFDEAMVVICSTTMLTGDPGTVDNPTMRSAWGSTYEGLPNGCEIYMMKLADFEHFAFELSYAPWVGQGIISITLVPDFPKKGVGDPVNLLNKGNCTAWKLTSANRIPHQQRTVMADFRSKINIPARYAGLNKFKVYPYAAVELTTYTGNPLVLKPELVGGSDIEVTQMTHVVPPGPRISFYPFRYGAGQSGTFYGANSFEYGSYEIWSDYGAEFLDMTCGFFNLPQFSITNSGYLTYMASNAHQIAYQYSSADWSQQRALAGNQLSFDQASAGMNLANQMTSIGIGAANASTDIANMATGLHGAASVGSAMAGGLMSGGMAGAALSAAGTVANSAISINANTQQNAVNTGAMGARNNAQVSNMGYMRDTNKQFADWAARGDYANAIASVNAKVQDAKLIPPTTAGQMGGDAYVLSTIGWGVHAKVKQLQSGVMEVIGEYWLRYGYALNRWVFMPDKYMCMEKMTYWKCKEVYLRSSLCPEYYKGVIRGIFEKGVTIWSDPGDIGYLDTSLAFNKPLTGITL